MIMHHLFLPFTLGFPVLEILCWIVIYFSVKIFFLEALTGMQVLSYRNKYNGQLFDTNVKET